jgi:hypothetical protein
MSTFPESALAKLEEESPPHETQALNQRRGQRYRSGRGGAKTNVKRMIQRNLNVVRSIEYDPKDVPITCAINPPVALSCNHW